MKKKVEMEDGSSPPLFKCILAVVCLHHIVTLGRALATLLRGLVFLLLPYVAWGKRRDSGGEASKQSPPHYDKSVVVEEWDGCTSCTVRLSQIHHFPRPYLAPTGLLLTGPGS